MFYKSMICKKLINALIQIGSYLIENELAKTVPVSYDGVALLAWLFSLLKRNIFWFESVSVSILQEHDMENSN